MIFCPSLSHILIFGPTAPTALYSPHFGVETCKFFRSRDPINMLDPLGGRFVFSSFAYIQLWQKGHRILVAFFAQVVSCDSLYLFVCLFWRFICFGFSFALMSSPGHFEASSSGKLIVRGSLSQFVSLCSSPVLIPPLVVTAAVEAKGTLAMDIGGTIFASFSFHDPVCRIPRESRCREPFLCSLSRHFADLVFLIKVLVILIAF